MTESAFEIPSLGLGTWQLTERQCEESVRQALELGYRHVDTARMYDNEEEVGRGLVASDVPRADVFLTTKLLPGELKSADVAPALEDSLERLGTDYVDLLLIHWPNGDVPLAGTLDAMLELREQEKTRFIGVSNFTVELWKQAREIAPVACNQVEYHPYLNQQPLLELARNEGLSLVAYSPLARGQVHGDRTLREIGARYGKSAAQVALRWLLQQQGVAAAIPKAGSPEHLRENLEVFDFELDPSDMDRISSMRGTDRIVDPAWAPWR